MANTIGSPPGSNQPKYTPLQAPGDLQPQPGAINATAPSPYQAFGNIAQIDPSYYSAVNANPFQQQQYLKQYNQLYTAGLQPTFNQQDLALNQNLASRGIGDSSAANYNLGQLYAQQGGQIAQGEAPMVQQAFAQTQQDVLANQAAQNQAAATNAAAGNASSLANAGFYNQAVTGNEAAYNSYLQSLYGSGVGQQNSLLSAYLNSFGPQTGVTNALNGAESGVGNTYSNIYGSALQGEGSALGGIGQGLGSYFGGVAAGKQNNNNG